LCIATGAAPFKPRIKGIDLDNVLVLRSNVDQEEIKKRSASAKSVVILGGGFIGSESASALKLQYKETQDVHMIYMENYPMERQLGPQVGEYLAKEHAKHGVRLYPQRKVSEIKGDGKNATSVVLDDGTEIKADLVLVGAGVLPATKFLEGSGIKLDQWGAVVCDPYLQSTVKDVFAAGDICSYPYWLTGQQQRIEHYISAMDQGSHAAFNMLGKLVPFGNVPFYWTRHYNKSIQYAGFASEFDEVHVTGSLEEGKFVAFYAKNGKIRAVSGSMQSAAVLTFMEFII